MVSGTFFRSPRGSRGPRGRTGSHHERVPERANPPAADSWAFFSSLLEDQARRGLLVERPDRALEPGVGDPAVVARDRPVGVEV